MVIESQTIEGFSLSAQQEHLWLLHDESNAAYYAQCLYLLEGTLDTGTLRLALQCVLNRNEILRTRFGCLNGMDLPLQIIEAEATLPLSESDLTALPQEAQQREVDALYEGLRELPVLKGDEIALRATLIRLAPDRHLLLLRLPALCADVVALQNLMAEICRCYENGGRESSLPEPGIQYVDYAQWLQEVVEAENAEVGRKFWQQDWSGPGSNELPFAQGEGGDFRPASVCIDLDPAALRSIQQAAPEGASLQDVLFAAWSALLGRLVGPEGSALVVAFACDGRKYAELQAGIGLYERYLPVRLASNGRLGMAELVKEARTALQDASRFQDYFSWQAAGSSAGSRTDAPFVPFAFDYHAEPSAVTVPTGLRMSLARCSVYSDRCLIRLSCIERAEGVSAEIHYDASALAESDVRRLGTWLQTLIASAASHPHAGIGSSNLLSSEERQALLVDFNATGTEYPRDRCVHELFEEQVERTPDAVAVVYESECLTYSELNRRANRLAHYLRKQGVGPETLVGFCVERSPEMMVGVLGILKAGGAYVPLDPSYPIDRLQFMLEDSGASVLVTQEPLRAGLPEYTGCLVCLDREKQEIDAESADNLPGIASPDNLVYVIYTSGSTGRPKGTMILHRGLTNYLTWAIQEYRVAEGQGAPVYSAIGFDLTVTGLFSPLLVGRRVVLVDQEAGIEALGEALRAQSDYSLIKITPAHLELLSRQLAGEQASGRTRAFIIGGEALRGESLAFWREHAPETRIVNEYGPTETVVGCCVYSRTAGECLPGPIAIGRPIANTQLYLLDRGGQPVPAGMAGELYIGGDGVARGYLNRPDLTAEKFVPDPFGSEPGARLYRTGDLCRALPDGNLEFLGRVDHQVKIRGYRIELGEIDSVLVRHSGVREAVVLAREDVPGERRLVAYVVVDPRSAPSLSDIRSYLKDALPDYMVPSAFVFLDALPLTANGKVDRRDLPIPDGSRPEVESYYEAPQTPAQEILTKIWGEVLRLERVGIHDNFFELGGDSILSIHIIARANQAGLHLTPRQVFQHQTIAGLSEVAGTGPQRVSEQGVIEGAVPLTPVQRWFFEYEGADIHHFNQARLLELHPSVAPRMVARVTEALIEHHDTLRLRFVPSETGGGWEQTNVARETGSVFSVVDLSEVADDEQEAAVTAACTELQKNLNLHTGPLLRVAYLDLGPAAPPRLFLAIHHLAMDGVSWRILLDDLQLGLEQLGRGENVAFPAKTTSFQHWANRLAAYAQSAPLHSEMDYWVSALGGTTGALPRDFAAGSYPVSSQQSIRVSLEPEETRALMQDVPAVYQTQINDVLLTVLVQAFYAWTGEASLLVDLEGHGREDLFEDVDLSRTVGWFTSMYPVLLELPAASGLGEALKGVKETLRGVPNSGIGYGLLRYLCAEEAGSQRLAALPKPEVNFNYLGHFDQGAQESGLFSPVSGSVGPSFGPDTQWRHLLDVIGHVAQDRLHVTWLYSDQVYQRATIERLAQGYLAALRELIAHCKSPTAGGYTPSDFPKAKVSQQALDRLFTGINKK